jgi:hypothetical protein
MEAAREIKVNVDRPAVPVPVHPGPAVRVPPEAACHEAAAEVVVEVEEVVAVEDARSMA